MVQEKPSKTVKGKKGSSSVKVCKNDTSKHLRGILNFSVLKLITKLFSFPVERLTHELQALKWEMAREEEQDQESEIDEDFLGSVKDEDEDEEDDADTIEEEPDFSCGSEEGLSSESAGDSETEDEETQMKSKRYTPKK